MMFGWLGALLRIGSANQTFQQKQGWTFHGHEFLSGKKKKYLDACTC
jgi:hypothetical protein